MDIREQLMRAVDALNAAGVPYAICGGLAVVIHGYTRLTDDIDLLARPEDVPHAKHALQSAGFSFANTKPLTLPHGSRSPLTIHRMLHIEGEDHLVLDLIETTPALDAVWNGRRQYRWEGRTISAVSREGLIAMKQAAGRPQDLADIESLTQKKPNE
jgi:hypothetical protein